MIRKMYLMLTAVVVATVVMFTSCWGSSDYLNALPGNSVVVAKVNVGNLLTESEILTDPQVTGFLKQKINLLSGDTRVLMRELLEDPSASGADLSEPVYMAIENVEQMRGLVIVPVSDAEKLKNLVSTLLSDRDLRIGLTLAKQGGVNTIEDESGNAVVAFDDDKLVMAFANGVADAMEYMNLSDAAQKKTDPLSDFISKKADAAFYVDYGQIVTLMERASSEFAGIDFNSLKEVKLITSLNFEKGKAMMVTEFTGSDDWEKLYNDMYTNPQNDLVGYLPHDTWAVAQLGVKNLAMVKEFIKGELEELMNKGFEELNSHLAEAGINTKWSLDLLSSLKGDVIFGVTPVVKDGYKEQPQMVIVAECENKNLFDAIVPLIKEEFKRAEKIGDNLYALGVNMEIDWENYDWHGDYTYVRKGNDYYFGFADGKMFVMPENLYKQCAPGNNLKGFEKSLKENSTLYSMIKSTNSMALDCTALATEISKIENEKAPIIANIVKKIEGLATKMNSPSEVEVVMTMADKDTEMLKQLKDLCVRFAIGEAVR
ncbi:MAG: DUF4836 family protein [Bacteroidaceae bacterium]|nr:DUF4836 family protein [Bacteroidaceae bacterium]